MKNKLYFFIALFYAFSQLAMYGQDDYVLWVRDQKNDQAFIDTIKNMGITIYVSGDAEYRDANITDERKDSISNAKVVVMSRSCKSDTYAPDTWNAFEVPIICMSQWLTRSSRLKWLDATDIELEIGPEVSILVPEDPIFDGITDADITMYTDLTSEAVITTDAGNGDLLAVSKVSGNAVIARWEPFIEFYNGSGQSPLGERIFFAAGAAGSPEASAVYNLDGSGHQLFKNLIRQYFPVTGIEDTRISNKLSVYPNPASESIHIDFQNTNGNKVFISILDITGKTVIKNVAGLSGSDKHCEINISNIDKGIYFLQATTAAGKNITTRKLVIE